MRVIRWPEPFNEQGRLAEGESARAMGKSALAGEAPSCPQILHVNLFFDGTNNNLEWDTKDAIKPTHSNVARLFRACSDRHAVGEYATYIPGVGTPFPEIGETEFSSLGKAFALGFGMRVAWGYTQLMNALHQAMAGDVLLYNPDARALSALIDEDVIASNKTLGDIQGMLSGVSPLAWVITAPPKLFVQQRLKTQLDRRHGVLSALQKKHSKPGGQLNRSIQKVWVNVFGFSRGAAAARVFVNRLINTWAPGGLIAGAIPYEVNFLGLFDTVASVGIPHSAMTAINLDGLDGHWAWTANGALNVPNAVKKCVHFFSIHEQRMSFPLDSIRMGQSYPRTDPNRKEVAYPGVHSDVGGGYVMGNEGKAREGDGSKLSQITLHNMYIEALKAGVPLMVQSELVKRADLVRDFSLAPSVARAFNGWLSTVSQKPLDSVEMALRVGMGQSLAWRTLRAEIGNPQTYVTAQPFFQHAKEDLFTPYGAEMRLASPQLDKLKREKSDLEGRSAALKAAALSMPTIPALANPFSKQAAALDEQIRAKETAIRETAAGSGRHGRPGEDIRDLTTNDKTDLLEAAEEFRLLLAYLRPEHRTRWQVGWSSAPATAVKISLGGLHTDVPLEQNPNAYYLTVDHMEVEGHRRQGSKMVWLGVRDRVIALLGAVVPYQYVADFVLAPKDEMLPFLLEHTSDEAVRALSPGVIRLMDDYVHDSRAWFRVTHFREYARGGYGWARMFFVGNDTQVQDLGSRTDFSSVAAQREQKATLDLGNFIAARAQTLPPQVNVDFSRFPHL